MDVKDMLEGVAKRKVLIQENEESEDIEYKHLIKKDILVEDDDILIKADSELKKAKESKNETKTAFLEWFIKIYKNYLYYDTKFNN